MKKIPNTLRLQTETLRTLGSNELARIAGGVSAACYGAGAGAGAGATTVSYQWMYLPNVGYVYVLR